MTSPATITLEMLRTVVGYGYAGQTIVAPNTTETQGLITSGQAIVSTDPPSYDPLYPPAYVTAAMVDSLSLLAQTVGSNPQYLSQANLAAAFAGKEMNSGTAGQVRTLQSDGTAVWATPTGGGGGFDGGTEY